MRYFRMIILFLLIVACDGKPRVHFDKINHDFGFVPQREKLSTTFTFSNKGNAPLRIIRVRAG